MKLLACATLLALQLYGCVRVFIWSVQNVGKNGDTRSDHHTSCNTAEAQMSVQTVRSVVARTVAFTLEPQKYTKCESEHRINS